MIGGMPPRRTIDELLADARSSLDRLTPEQTVSAMEDGAVLVDVRSDHQRERDGIVPAAVHHPRNVLEWRADPESDARDERIADHGKRLIVMCDEGYASSLAAATLQELGFDAATDLDGGFQAWRAAGLPVEPLRHEGEPRQVDS
jgi:rhodanese-related sulfurtransferase